MLSYLANGSRSADGTASEFRVLYRLYVAVDAGSYRERAVEPLFDWEKNSETGKRYFSLLWFLYVSKQESAAAPVKRSMLFIPLPF